jgi:transposase, IS5 family
MANAELVGGPALECVAECADFAVAKKPSDLRNWQIVTFQIAFRKIHFQFVQNFREGQSLRRQPACTHVKALPNNPYDGHTLATVIPDMEALVGNTIARILADKGYRGHNAPPDYRFRVFIFGQKRGVTPKIKRELRRRSAVEPVIGHLKAEHRVGRNYLWFRRGDAANAILAAAGYNFRRLIRWLTLLFRQLLIAPTAALQTVPA